MKNWQVNMDYCVRKCKEEIQIKSSLVVGNECVDKSPLKILKRLHKGL